MGAGGKLNGNDNRARVLDLVANRAGVEVSLLGDTTDIFRDAGIGHDFLIDYQDDVYGLAEDLIREFDIYWLDMRWERHFPDTSEPIRFSNITELVGSFIFFVSHLLLLPVALIWPRVYETLGITMDGPRRELPEPVTANLLPDDYIAITVADLIRVAEHRLWECRYDSPDGDPEQPRINPRHLDEFLQQHRSRYGDEAEETARRVVTFVAEWRGIEPTQCREDMDLHLDLGLGSGLARWAGSFTDYTTFFRTYLNRFEVAIQELDYRRHFPAAFAWTYLRLVWAFPCYVLAIPFRFFFPNATERSKQWLFRRLDGAIWKLGRRWVKPRRGGPQYLGITVADLIRAAQLGVWRPGCDKDDID